MVWVPRLQQALDHVAQHSLPAQCSSPTNILASDSAFGIHGQTYVVNAREGAEHLCLQFKGNGFAEAGGCLTPDRVPHVLGRVWRRQNVETHPPPVVSLLSEDCQKDGPPLGMLVGGHSDTPLEPEQSIDLHDERPVLELGESIRDKGVALFVVARPTTNNSLPG